MKTTTSYFQIDPRMVGIFLFLSLLLFGMGAIAHGQIEGFTEPFRSVDLSSDETGIIQELNFQQGEIVQEGDVIARLDDRVQRVQLELARHMTNAKSAKVAAEMALKKRVAIHERIQQLIVTNNASESELIRSEVELSIAKSKLLATEEEGVTRQLELKQAEAQLARRSIIAPFSGTVDVVHRQEGEFLSPIRPEVVKIVQLDRLFAKFNVPSSLNSNFQVGQEIELEMANGEKVTAKVYSIGVQTDAQSGTIEIKFVINNSEGNVRSGEICLLNV